LFDDLVAFGASDARRRGCLLTNSAVELAASDKRVREKIAGNLETLENVLTARLLAAQRAGEIAPKRSPRALARFIVSSIQGIRVMSKVSPDEAALRDIADTVLDALG
jgi:TetR/AcrR family transcriptional repressor of nem operon